MRFGLIVALLCANLVAAAQSEISFDNRVQKFKKVEAGEILSFDFSFVNTGNEPLIIAEVKTSCGCTKPEFPRQPILPGESGVIVVGFNTEGKIGYQDRELQVHSNASNNPTKIRFKGVVSNKASK